MLGSTLAIRSYKTMNSVCSQSSFFLRMICVINFCSMTLVPFFLAYSSCDSDWLATSASPIFSEEIALSQIYDTKLDDAIIMREWMRGKELMRGLLRPMREGWQVCMCLLPCCPEMIQPHMPMHAL